MIISEKQVWNLIQVGNLYLRVLDQLIKIDPALVTDGGRHNKVLVATLLQEITDQQPENLMDISDK